MLNFIRVNIAVFVCVGTCEQDFRILYEQKNTFKSKLYFLSRDFMYYNIHNKIINREYTEIQFDKNNDNHRIYVITCFSFYPR